MKKRAILKIVLVLVSLAISLLLCEKIYRYQLFDFYRTEFTELNSTTTASKPSVLVFGDSFTAFKESYVKQLRTTYPNYNFINCAISGTGIQEVNYIIKKRIGQNAPTAVLFQLYPANDLSDITKPLNWSTLSEQRNLFWTLSDHFHLLRHLNYKLGGLKRAENHKEEYDHGFDEKFNIKLYNKRSKIYLQARPDIISQTCMINEEWAENNFETYVKTLKKVIAKTPDQIPINIVIVPHCSQVNKAYYDRFKMMGASLPSTATHFNPDYAFALKLDAALKGDKRIQIINPLKEFQQLESKGQRLYYDYDPHLNKQGQKALAAIIEKHLNKLLVR